MQGIVEVRAAKLAKPSPAESHPDEGHGGPGATWRRPLGESWQLWEPAQGVVTEGVPDPPRSENTGNSGNFGGGHGRSMDCYAPEALLGGVTDPPVTLNTGNSGNFTGGSCPPPAQSVRDPLGGR